MRAPWTEQKSDDGSWRGVRELPDLDLLDVSCVVYPAYSGTGVNAPVEEREQPVRGARLRR